MASIVGCYKVLLLAQMSLEKTKAIVLAAMVCCRLLCIGACGSCCSRLELLRSRASVLLSPKALSPLVAPLFPYLSLRRMVAGHPRRIAGPDDIISSAEMTQNGPGVGG